MRNYHRVGRWVSWGLGVLCLGAAAATTVAAQDTVLLSTASSSGRTKLTGRILDYTQTELRIELPSGRQQIVPAGDVTELETTHAAEQTQGREAFERRQFSAALALFRQALRSEPRPWMLKQIRAETVRCYQALGQLQEAGDAFLELAADDPPVSDFAAIPLAWTADVPSSPLADQARRWVAREELPAAVLLGASHLLTTADRAAALKKIQQLSTHSDAVIAGLATAQLCGTEVAKAQETQRAAWEKILGELPAPLRAGPYFVLGQAQAAHAQWQRAALSFLRVPLLYPQQTMLAAQALVEAGHALEQGGSPTDAVRLYRETVDRYGTTPAAQQARSRLLQLGKTAVP